MTLAHQVAGPSDVWSSWNLDPLVIATLLLAAVAYTRGIRILRRHHRAAIGPGRMAAYYAALALAATALLSPLHSLAETLFAGHMVQHLILILGVAPLIVLGAPALPLLVATPAPLRRAGGRLRNRPAALLAAPLAAWGLHAAVMWAWHLPALYMAAVRNEVLHGLEHLSFVGTAILVWAIALPSPRKQRHPATAIGVLFGTALQSGALGAILTFSTTALYSVHTDGAPLWKLTSLEDQQLAGVIMWVPAGAVYFLAIAVIFAKWMKVASSSDVADPALLRVRER